MLTWENILYYIKWFITNSWFAKIFFGAIFAVFTQFICCDRLLTLQFIFISWVFIMIIGTIAGTIKEWFTFYKFFKWTVRLVGYYIILFFGMAFDHAFDTGIAFNFFYATIIIDMIHSFLKHAPAIGIYIPSKIFDFIQIAEKKVSSFFLNKVWITEDLNKKYDKKNTDII